MNYNRGDIFVPFPIPQWCQGVPILILQWWPHCLARHWNLWEDHLTVLALQSSTLPFILIHSATRPCSYCLLSEKYVFFHTYKNPILMFNPFWTFPWSLLLSTHSEVLSLSSKPQYINFSCSTSHIDPYFIKYLYVCFFLLARV